MSDASSSRSKFAPSVNPRVIVYRAFLAILERQLTAEQALDAEGWKNLSPSDKAFSKRLLLACLRQFHPLWHVLQKFLNNPLDKNRRGQKLEAVFILGLCELLVLETPPHAAVSSALKIAESDQEIFPLKKLINGVLRTVDRERDKAFDVKNRCSALPLWLWGRWKKIYGADTLKAIEASLAEIPALDITVKNPADTAKWAEKLNADIICSVRGSLRLNDAGDVTALEGYEAGEWWIQNTAAATAISLLGDIQGQSVLDVCAAPGGKTLQLASKGAKVTAVDVSKSRLKRLQDNLDRTNLQANVICGDAVTWKPNGQFDVIVIDAPCSATGTLRRHPEIVLNREEKGLFANTTPIQKDILNHNSQFLKTGGTLVYVTCSLEPEEGEQQIEQFLKTHQDFKRIAVTADNIKDLSESLTPQGDIRILPHSGKGKMDGFFISLLSKV